MTNILITSHAVSAAPILQENMFTPPTVSAVSDSILVCVCRTGAR